MTKTEILDAINLLLVSKWPDRTVYVDVCPLDFNRPSFWLTVEKYDLTDGNRFLIRHDLQIRLTLYDALRRVLVPAFPGDGRSHGAAHSGLDARPPASEAAFEGAAPGPRPGVCANQSVLDGQPPRARYRSIHPRRRRLFRHGSGRHQLRGAIQWDFPNLLFL